MRRCGLLHPARTVRRAATPATEAFIQQKLDKGIYPNSPSLSEAQRREQFRTFLLELAASRRSRLHPGPYAAGAAPADADDSSKRSQITASPSMKGINRIQAKR